MKQHLRAALSSLAAVSLLISAQAIAVPQSRAFRANAASYCQSALPVFDGQIRKRPLAVQNEGDSNAFVTCSFTRQTGADVSVPATIFMRAFTVNEVEQSLTCTMVAGRGGKEAPPPQYLPKTVLLGAGGTSSLLEWHSSDFAGGVTPNTEYSLSCNLLPGVALEASAILFDEDVGQ